MSDPGHISARALFRGRRWQRALHRANKSLLVGYRDGRDDERPFTDTATALRHRLPIVLTRRLDPEFGVVVRGRVDIPQASRRSAGDIGTRRWGSLFREVQDAVDAGTGFGEHREGAEDVMGVLLPSGREVYIPGLLMRIVHALVADALGPLLLRAAPRSLYSYLPGRSRFEALHHARAHVRDGLVFAARFDIRKFFSSTSVALVDAALDAELPQIELDLRRLIRWLHAVNVVRRPGHRGVKRGRALPWQLPMGTLMQGTAVAAPLSNIVGTFALDRPFARAVEGVTLLRYGDDGLLLGRSASEVADALELVGQLAALHGFELHPDKTSRAPIDLRRERVTWLGKEIDISGVTTPAEARVNALVRMVRRSPGTTAHRARARDVLRELLLDPTAVLTATEEQIFVDAEDSLPAFHAARATWASERNELLGRFDRSFKGDQRPERSVP